jgi:hypothetical protein
MNGFPGIAPRGGEAVHTDSLRGLCYAAPDKIWAIGEMSFTDRFVYLYSGRTWLVKYHTSVNAPRAISAESKVARRTVEYDV